MGYVMVPVPEHHQKEFGIWVLQMTMRAALATWNPEKLAAAVARLDDDDRRIVAKVASIKGFWADAPTVADALEMDRDEVLQRVNDMNHACFEADAPPLVMVRHAEQSRTGRAQFMMDSEIRDDLLKAMG